AARALRRRGHQGRPRERRGVHAHVPDRLPEPERPGRRDRPRLQRYRPAGGHPDHAGHRPERADRRSHRRHGVLRRPRSAHHAGRGGARVTGLRIPPEAGPEERATEFADAAEPAAQASAEPPGRFGVAGWLRWGWRQLTSMRTALILLFLLAVGSVPGSLLPQEGSNPQAVAQYYAAHPALAPILARFSLFNVFGAPWFAAIYLLLFLSLVGCVLPRTVRMVGSARQPPPAAPRHLARLPRSVSYRTAQPPEQALASAARLLSAKRFRVRAETDWVAAEKGYLREAGNLLFHIALLAVLVSIGLGGLFGYKANRLLVAGTSFSNTVTALDVFRPGRLVTPGDLQPFSLT